MARVRSGAFRRGVASVLLTLGMLAVASPASADEYDPKYAGHPLRILAYIVHPVGVMFDYLLFRPAHWVGSHEPFKTIFGHTDY
jgi:hypothetical protein